MAPPLPAAVREMLPLPLSPPTLYVLLVARARPLLTFTTTVLFSHRVGVGKLQHPAVDRGRAMIHVGAGERFGAVPVLITKMVFAWSLIWPLHVPEPLFTPMVK